MIDDINAERIARELIAEIAAKWEDRPDAYHVEKDGEHIFVFTLHPTEEVRYARVVQRPISISTFHFNPLAEAAEIVSGVAFSMKPSAKNSDVDDYSIRDSSLRRIHQMLVSAPDVFRDAMWQARIVGETLTSVGMMELFGRPDLARGLVNSAVTMIEERTRKGFGSISKTRRPKINNFSIHMALRTFFKEFERTGAIPSQRQFARSIGVTPKAWRDFLSNRKLEKHEISVKRWLEELRDSYRDESEGVGSISGGDTTHGD